MARAGLHERARRRGWWGGAAAPAAGPIAALTVCSSLREPPRGPSDSKAACCPMGARSAVTSAPVWCRADSVKSTVKKEERRATPRGPGCAFIPARVRLRSAAGGSRGSQATECGWAAGWRSRPNDCTLCASRGVSVESCPVLDAFAVPPCPPCCAPSLYYRSSRRHWAQLRSPSFLPSTASLHC